MAITSNDYIVAVKEKYELAKNGVYGGFLLEPSSAQLRDLCLLVFDKGLKKKDEEVFANFFKPKEEKGLRKAIENVDVEKLRTVCNFLKGVSKKTNLPILNLIAVLVDYEMRPFSQFINKGNISDAVLYETYTVKSEIDIAIENENKQIKKTETSKNRFIKRVGIGVIGLLGFFTVGYTVKDILLPEEECMQWKNDHYEVVSCANDHNEFESLNIVKPINKIELSLKKIIPTATTTYFKNGKPMVWYYKKGAYIELYNRPGCHPENGKTLKEITPYIIDKYFKK